MTDNNSEGIIHRMINIGFLAKNVILHPWSTIHPAVKSVKGYMENGVAGEAKEKSTSDVLYEYSLAGLGMVETTLDAITTGPRKSKKSNPNTSYKVPEISIVWGKKFATLAPDQKIHAEKAINDILYEGSRGNLDEKSVKINSLFKRICDRLF